MTTTNPPTPRPSEQTGDADTEVLTLRPDEDVRNGAEASPLRRRRRRTWTGVGVLAATLVAVLVLAVAIPAQQRQARIDRLTVLAAQDAETLDAASGTAGDAAAAAADTVAAGQRYLDEVVLTATEAVMAAAPLASPEAIAALQLQVDAFAVSQDWEPVPGDPSPSAEFDAPDLAAALAERYIAAEDEAQVPAEEVRREVDRLESLVAALAARDADFVDLVTQFEAALDATVASLPNGVATVEAEAPRAAPEALDGLRAAAAGLAADATLAAFQEAEAVSSVAGLDELLDGAVERLPAVVEKVNAFRAEADRVRASHSEVVAAEEAAAAAAVAAAARQSGSGSSDVKREPFCSTVNTFYLGDLMLLYRCD